MPGSPNEILLIYIPCWKDYEQALEQAIRLREQFSIHYESNKDIGISLEIVLSVNGVKLSNDEQRRLATYVDELIYFDSMLGMDTNMNQGYLKSITRQADYYWLLSANDQISNKAIGNILQNLPKSRDLLLFSRENSEEILEVKSIFLREFATYPFGLISSVIYANRVFADYFPQALRLNWTGWGQLAVIESACIERNGISVSAISEEKIFNSPTLEDNSKTRASIRSTYNHSFFGLPILINSLYQHDRKARKKFINEWIVGNWLKIGYFDGHRKPALFTNSKINQSWIQETSYLILKNNSFLSWILVVAGRRINLNNFFRLNSLKLLFSRIKK